MSYKNISRILFAAMLVAAATLAMNTSDAGFGLHSLLPSQTGCCRRCPACDHVCKLDAELVDEARTCFDVESKVVCIPRVVFPWQKRSCQGPCDACDGTGCNQCNHNGARTRRVCVLKTDKYKCPKCEYTWSAEKNPCAPGCDSSCDAGFASTRSQDAPSPTLVAPQPMVYRELPAPQDPAPQDPAPQDPAPQDGAVETTASLERLPAPTK